VDVLTELTFPGGGTTTLHAARSVSESDPMALRPQVVKGAHREHLLAERRLHDAPR